MCVCSDDHGALTGHSTALLCRTTTESSTGWTGEAARRVDPARPRPVHPPVTARPRALDLSPSRLPACLPASGGGDANYRTGDGDAVLGSPFVAAATRLASLDWRTTIKSDDNAVININGGRSEHTSSARCPRPPQTVFPSAPRATTPPRN